MPLRITNAVTDVAIINRWADGIEKELKRTSHGVAQIFATINPAPGVNPNPALSVAFDKIKSGTNITADMEVGSGAVLQYKNNGIVNANEIGTIKINGNLPTHAGEILISQPGNTTAVWADPLVQGLNPPGTDGTTINPVVIGGVTDAGKVKTASFEQDGALDVFIANEPVVTIKDIDGEPVVIDKAVNVRAVEPIAILDSVGNPIISTNEGLNVFVTNAAASSGNPAAGLTGAAVPTSADYTGFNSGGLLVGVSAANPLPVNATFPGSLAVTQSTTPWVDNVSQFGGSNVVTGTGVSGAGIPRVTVSSDSFPATQAVTLPAGQAVELLDSGGVNKASISAAGAVKVDGSAVTQPVSGTITTTPPANATTNITQFGSNNVVTGTGVSGVGIPRVTVSSDSFPATQAVSGTVTVTQPTGTNLHVVVDSAPTTAVTLPAGQAVELLDSGGTNKASISAAGALKVDGSAVTQPVSGTVAVTQGTSPWLTADAANGVVGANQPTTAEQVGVIDPNGKIRGLNVDGQGNLLIAPNALMETLREILLELRSIRFMNAALLSDDGRYQPEDFNSGSFQSEIVSETSLN